MIGLDTSAIVDIFRGELRIKEFLNKNQEPLAVNIISYLELSFGLEGGNPSHDRERKFYDEFFNTLYNFDLTRESCEEASKILSTLKKNGRMIEPFDCTIAGIFLSNGIRKILTRNPKHFERVKGLETISY